MNLRKRTNKKSYSSINYDYESDNDLEYENSRYISKKKKEIIISNQSGKCNNSPSQSIISGYECPFWKWNNGNVDTSGLEFDHIEEWSKTKDNSIQNLQGLCVCCHKMKTKIFMNHGKEFTSLEIMNGMCKMDVDVEPSLKKRRVSND